MPTLHLVRHAQPDFQGHYDSLTALGYEQAAWLGEHYASLGVHFDRVVCGALARQSETLRTLLGHLPGTLPPIVDSRLDEYDAFRLLTRFAGKVDSELRAAGDRRAYFATLREALIAWSADPAESPGIETWAQFGARIRGAIEDLRAGLKRDARILVVTSGGVIGRCVADALGADAAAAIALNLQTRNTGITELALGRSATRLVAFNAVPHLERPDRAHALTYS